MVTETLPFAALRVPRLALETLARLTVTSVGSAVVVTFTVVVLPATPVTVPAGVSPASAPRVEEPPAEVTVTVWVAAVPVRVTLRRIASPPEAPVAWTVTFPPDEAEASTDASPEVPVTVISPSAVPVPRLAESPETLM